MTFYFKPLNDPLTPQKKRAKYFLPADSHWLLLAMT